MLLSRRSRLAALTATLAALAAACGRPAESDVNVKTIATNLVYGIPQRKPAALPANLNPNPENPLPVLIGGKLRGPLRLPASGPPPDPCPATPPTVFPGAAPSEIQGRPMKGEYVWRLMGQQEATGIGKIRFPPFARRSILKVVQGSRGEFAFVVEERELVFGSQYTVRSTYEVRKGRDQPANQAPQNGLFLTSIERIHRSDSGSNSTFNPNPPILVLPTPVVLGKQVDSVGVDPVSLEVLRQDGVVSRRQRVDACGEPVDTFYVQTTQEFVASDGRQSRRRYDYGVATLIGAVPVIEHIESPCAEQPKDPQDPKPASCTKSAVTFQLDAHIGQLRPT